MNPVHLEQHTNQSIPPMPMLALMRRVLMAKYAQQKVDALAEQLQMHYAALYMRRPVFANPALRTHVEGKILPGLSLYQTLLAEGMSPEAALQETENMLTALVRYKWRWVKLLTVIPGTFWFLRKAVGRMMSKQYVEPGFEFEWVENSPRRIAFTMTRCLYYNTLSAYGAPELTSAFCHGDDVLGVVLAPKVVFERSQTIGRGDHICDFCYRSAGRT
ncbi:MAG: L-2-amino-thiazoline-4-carboxylic acid hydrolase [Anaerolineae bacterium]|nr:L-2-amino-thiazoline-4-carboxylic acid hydrolase [Anaerolineae bacterium]